MISELIETENSRFWCLRHAHREMLTSTLVAVSLGVLAGLVVTVSVLCSQCRAGFPSYFDLLAFVALCAASCWPFYHALSAVVLVVLRTRPPAQILLACIACALFAALPFTAVAMAFLPLFQPKVEFGVTWLGIYASVAVSVLVFGCIVHYIACQRVLLQHAANGGANNFLGTQAVESAPVEPATDESDARFADDKPSTPQIEEAKPPYATPEATARPPVDSTPVEKTDHSVREKLFDHLPHRLGRDIVYLTVSGHYVNVVTTTGSALILMRLTDAVAALGELGMRVHRSYWVAHNHIASVQRRDGRMLLRLTNGVEVPVSRSHMMAVDSMIADSARQRRSG